MRQLLQLRTQGRSYSRTRGLSALIHFRKQRIRLLRIRVYRYSRKPFQQKRQLLLRPHQLLRHSQIHSISQQRLPYYKFLLRISLDGTELARFVHHCNDSFQQFWRQPFVTRLHLSHISLHKLEEQDCTLLLQLVFYLFQLLALERRLNLGTRCL